MATKAKPAAKKPAAAPATKKPAAKAAETKTAAAPKPVKLLEVGAFATFTGYKSEMSAEDAVFKADEKVVVVSIDNDEKTGTLYTAVRPEDYAAYLEDPENYSGDGGQVAPSEVAPVKGTELIALQERFTPIKLVGRMEEILAENPDDLIAAAQDLNNAANESYFYLGGVLAKVLQEGVYLKENGGDFEGDTAFEDFCQTTFGKGQAWGRDLARIYVTFAALPNFTPEMLQGVGWSNARAIQRFVTEDNLTEIVEIAANTTQRELPAILTEKYVTEGNRTPSGAAASRGASIKKVAITFKLSEDAAQGVTMALEEVRKEKNFDNDNDALEHIIMTYASEHVASGQKQQRIAKKLAPAATAKVKPKPGAKAEEAAEPASA